MAIFVGAFVGAVGLVMVAAVSPLIVAVIAGGLGVAGLAAAHLEAAYGWPFGVGPFPEYVATL